MTGLGDRHHPDLLIEITGLRIFGLVGVERTSPFLVASCNCGICRSGRNGAAATRCLTAGQIG